MSSNFENARDTLSLFPPPRNPGLPVFRLMLRKSGKPDLRWGRAREGGTRRRHSEFAFEELPPSRHAFALRASAGDLPLKGGGEERKRARELRLGAAA